jgi:hypothetical protein
VFLCGLLLDLGRYSQVVEQVKITLPWSEQHGFRRETALEHINLGWALSFVGPDYSSAVREMDIGVDGIRNTGYLQYYSEALVTRGAFHRRYAHVRGSQDFRLAWDDLHTALDIAESTGQHLVECDALCVAAKLHLDSNQYGEAKSCVARIEAIVGKCGYELRRADLRLLYAWLAVLDGDKLTGTAILQKLWRRVRRIGYKACDEDIEMVKRTI